MKNTIKEVQSFEQLEFCMKQKHLAPEEMVSSVPTYMFTYSYMTLKTFCTACLLLFTS